MKPWTICSKKKYPLHKFAYVNTKLNYLAWATTNLYSMRTFETKEDAVKWLDNKWMKYGNKVNEWKPIKTDQLIKYWESKP